MPEPKAEEARLIHHGQPLRWSLAPAPRRRLLLLACTLALALPGHAQRPRLPRTVPESPYTRAATLRAQLAALPLAERTRARYEAALDAFRAVYHGNPADPRAAESVYAVSLLLREQGETSHDPKALRDAIAQDEFLRRNYPESEFAPRALLDEATTEREDLHDEPAATAVLKQFLRLYPHHALAAEARAELHERPGTHTVLGFPNAQPSSHRNAVLDAALASRAPGAGASVQRPAPVPAPDPTVGAAPSTTARTPSSKAAAAPSIRPSSASLVERDLPPPSTSPNTAPASTAAPARTWPGSTPAIASQPSAAPQPSLTRPRPTVRASSDEGPPVDEATSSTPSVRTLPPALTPAAARLPQVTGVRHWSTSVYTRVAIDLGAEVQYEVSRVPSPDRILFDLHGVRLAPELAGRAVTVTDGGYLERIRLAQRAPDVVRVVLDVSEVSEYSAFLLPNPWRLIVDIHRKAGAPQLAAAPLHPTPAASETPTPPPPTRATGTGSVTARLARPVPTGDDTIVGADTTPRRAHRANPAALAEVATLDRAPGTVRATPSPTSAPVTATVADTQPAPQPGTTAVPAPDLTTRAAASTNPQGARAAATRAHGVSPADTPAPAVHLSAAAPTPGTETRPAEPTAAGERSMVRTLGLKINRIVIDAGHGGHDSGTLGPGGIEEKDVVLDVALRLGRLLKQRSGADVIFTRDDDTFIPLETRTAIANKAQADLFISVHANSSPDAAARGVETYYLNFTTSADALEVAARENAVSDQSIHQLSDLVKKITLQDKIAESHEFASDVQGSLFDGLENGNPGLKDRGVKKAPFVVLIGANMPSILAEISFLTNPDDANELRDPAYRQRIAESLYRGVQKYMASLNGVRLAQGK